MSQLTRMESLRQWTKRTQEVLAHRSLQGKTFDSLYNLLRTKRLVEVALDGVLQNEGARTPGVDGITKEDLQTPEARAKLVEELNHELCTKTYRHGPVRRTYVPKDNGDMRPLGIPNLRDRVVQEMLRLILEPIYEAHFYKHSYGFRPFRSTHHAAFRVKDLIGKRGYTIAIEGDIRKCFDRIHHLKLLRILRKTIKDERIIHIIRDMLQAGVMEDGAWHTTDGGTPQGGIASPLLANIYLNELDQFIFAKWEKFTDAEKQRLKRSGQALMCYIVRYCDDFVVLTRGTMEQAEQLKADIAAFLQGELHLELSTEKTLITDVRQGIDFLGFTIRKYQNATLITPSQKALRKFRQKVKQRVWEGFSTDNDAGAIERLNRYLIGWGMYYRRVSSSRAFQKADNYVWWRVFKTSRRLRNPNRTPRQHYQAHYLPYRYDLRAVNRKHKGKNYGAWADAGRTTAHIVINLVFIPIRYAKLHPQLNPYVPEERAILEKRIGELELPPDQLPGPVYHPDYGMEWDMLRRTVLNQAGHRCWRCQKHLKAKSAHVHHRLKRKSFKHRKQANLLDNLIALCPTCHKWAENRTNLEALST